jgi:hypothetical protein
MLESMRQSTNVAMLVFQIGAISMEVFLHRGFGERYLGPRAAAVFILIPLYSLGWQGYDLQPLFLFLGAYLLMCFVARAGIAERVRRGEQCHSFYTGWPRFLGPKAKISEIAMKRFWEPGITGLLGLAVRDFNAPLGTYLIFGAISMACSVGASEAIERQRALDMNDAVIDQQQTAERFREMRGERY